ncbi:MAG TPA: T9SS type A sorting domain-containing protein, partial [Chitinophagales bacterium]|nr:T9SS type A sorting domain-containing protein [Chitinophagales bacterium]
TSCWGNISQDLNSYSIQLNVSCKGGPAAGRWEQGEGQRHAGNSLYAINDPYYNDVDLLNGNLGYDNVLLLRNCGDTTNANICQWDSIFPSCNTPIFIPVYPAAYGVHISGGATEDLLVSPNVAAPYVIGGGSGRNIKNVMYFKNLNDTTCWYEYQNDSFLVHHMLDIGTESKPVFYDLDGDGLNDITAGNFGYFVPFHPYKSGLAFYRNTGTATQPEFTEVTDDFDSLSRYSLVNFNPAFGDLDGDGKSDLLAGDLYGNLYLFKNMAITGSSFPAMTAYQYFGIDVGAYAAPFIYDVNGDSLPDLIVGRQNGGISYFWNFGTRTNAQFSPDSVNSNFGGINVSVNGSAYGYSQPSVIKDTNGALKLYVGSLTGHILKYEIDTTKLRAGNFVMDDSDVLETNTGANTAFSMADLNADGDMEYIVGSAAGGFLLYSDSLWDSSVVLGIHHLNPVSGQMQVYPNPSKSDFNCIIPASEVNKAEVAVYDILGRQIGISVKRFDGRINIQPQNAVPGLYVITIRAGSKTYTARVLISN